MSTRDYQLQFHGKFARQNFQEKGGQHQLNFSSKQPRVVRRSGDQNQQRCHSDLVKFEEGFGGVVNYNYHSGICVAKLHLPYGYATQLRFNTSNGKTGKLI